MKNVTTNALMVLLSGAAAGLGCSGGGSVDIGNTQAVGAQLSDYAASWDGYAQAYTFSPDGSDRVRLTIDASGHGNLQIGNAALLPTPTDPNVGFPTEAAAAILLSGPRSPVSILNEGFLYPTYAAQVQADRVQVGIDPGDLEATWCALQTPVALSHLVVSATDGALIVPLGPDGELLSPAPGDGGTTTTIYNCRSQAELGLHAGPREK